MLIDKGADPSIAGAAIDEPELFLCPVDHVVDSPELMKLFRSHPRCTPPDIGNYLFSHLSLDLLIL